MLSAAADGATKIAVHRIGPALVFEQLWEETGCAVTFVLRPVLRHPAEPLPAVYLGGRVWLSGRSCKSWPAA
jgi:hypothetical protein